MNNFDDILDVKAETPAEVPKDTRPQRQVKQQQNRETAYQITDAAIEEFTTGKADVKRYLDVQSRFLSYSVRNTLLVMKKNPDATRIGDYSYWRGQNAEVLRDETKNPIIILEPGKEFKREDGSVGQYYNAKEVYDVSQTTARDTVTPTVAYDDRILLKALISKSPVSIKVVNDLPDGRGAMLDTSEQAILVKRGMAAHDIFKCVSAELANVELEFQNPAYNRNVEGYKAYFASYMLCKRYGVDTKDFMFEGAGQTFSGKDAHAVTAELNEIKETAKTIDTRMTRALEQNKSPKAKTEVR